MAEGRVKWYNEKKGYGFIVVEGEEDLFFHRSGIKEFGHFGLQQDDPVSYEVKNTARGKQAINIRPIKMF